MKGFNGLMEWTLAPGWVKSYPTETGDHSKYETILGESICTGSTVISSVGGTGGTAVQATRTTMGA